MPADRAALVAWLEEAALEAEISSRTLPQGRCLRCY